MITDTLFSQNVLWALAMAAAIGAAGGLIGSLMLTKRMALMGGALGHLAMPGVALGLLYGFDMSLGAFAFVLVGIFFIWLLESKTKLPFDATTAIVFPTFMAISFLFLPHEETHVALLGDISNVTWQIALVNIILSIVVFVLIRIIYYKMVLIGISQEMARVNRVPIKLYVFLYLLCIAAVVALGVRIVGGLMTASLVAIPAATSRNLSGTVKQYRFVSGLFGCLSCVLGVIVATAAKIPIGSSIILASTLFFVISLAVKKIWKFNDVYEGFKSYF